MPPPEEAARFPEMVELLMEPSSLLLKAIPPPFAPDWLPATVELMIPAPPSIPPPSAPDWLPTTVELVIVSPPAMAPPAPAARLPSR